MALMPDSVEALYLGIDGGGSKCRAVITSEDGRVLGEGLSGPANPCFGVERTITSILDATEQALNSAGLDSEDKGKLIAGVGLAGVNLPHLFTAVNEWQHPFQRMYLTSDLHTACLGAHEGKEGAVIVVGTGSCGFSSVNGETLNLGGHGFLMGDQGSGAWIGLEAIKAVLLAGDELGSQTLLSASIEQLLGCKGLGMIEKMVDAPSRSYAKVAPLVFDAAEQGDMIATAILTAAGQYINALALKLLSTNPPRLSMIGGVSMRLLPWLDSSVVEQVLEPIEQPEFGAIHFAKQKMNEQAVVPKSQQDHAETAS